MYKYILTSLVLVIISVTWVHASAEKITRAEAFIFFAELVWSEIPESFKYIGLEYKWVAINSNLETALKKLVYTDLISNSTVSIGARKQLSTKEFIALADRILWIKLQEKENAATTISIADLQEIEKIYAKRKDESNKVQVKTVTPSGSLSDKEKILFDVKKTLERSHYNAKDFEENQLIDAAIKGLTEGADDTYTTYFPPTDSKNFFTNLDWTYEWIGAYVEMPKPGEMIIISPISWSPSESAWIKWGDRIIKVDDKTITPENSINEVVSWIKWPANTSVDLTIIREGIKKSFIISVQRQKITLKDIEYEKIDSRTAYIWIKNFGDSVAKDFAESLEEIAADKQVKKIIFDLRNNPGWYLDQVSAMLSYFIAAWEATAIVSYGTKDVPYPSTGKSIISLSDYEIVFLQNSGSASASEIMVGTLKDYYPQATIVWEQSFWKWSVQSLKNYKDGSTLKFTTAKWYTGKTRQGIDGVGISPDVFVEFDKEQFDTYKIDTQLEAAVKQ